MTESGIDDDPNAAPRKRDPERELNRLGLVILSIVTLAWLATALVSA